MKQNMCKLRFAFASLALLVSMSSFSQGGTLSPYSQYAFGEIASAGGSMSRGMDGLGIGIHRGAYVNPLNPASYAYADSLTMLFDMGISGQITNYNENGHKINARQANFEYFLGSFRLWKNIGMTVGVVPVTNVGYEYTSKVKLDDANKTTVEEIHEGEGGLHQLLVGIGVRPFKFLAVGANFGYLWGGFDRGVATNSSSTLNNLSKQYHASVHNYVLEFGLQLDQRIGQEDLLTIGAKYGFGHKLGSDPECLIISANSQISKSDTTRLTVSNALELPHSFAGGFSYSHGTQWLVGADAEVQLWGKTSFPEYDNNGYAVHSGLLKNSYRVTVGGELCPRWNSRNFFQRVRYRIGASYATPYYKIHGLDGPKKFSATVGFGIPIMNSYNNRSFLNISAQYINNAAKGLIKENTFCINLGLTFNEKWFAKWKVE